MKPLYKRLVFIVLSSCFIVTSCISTGRAIQDWNVARGDYRKLHLELFGPNNDLPPRVNTLRVDNTSFDCLVEKFVKDGFRMGFVREDKGFFSTESKWVARHNIKIRNNIYRVDENSFSIITEYKKIDSSKTFWNRAQQSPLNSVVLKFDDEYPLLYTSNLVKDCGDISFFVEEL